MDDADMRRGKPSCHKVFGDATAILAGDALQTLAFEILAGAATHDDAAIRIRLVAHLAGASGLAGMAGSFRTDAARALAYLNAPGFTTLMANLFAMRSGETSSDMDDWLKDSLQV